MATVHSSTPLQRKFRDKSVAASEQNLQIDYMSMPIDDIKKIESTQSLTIMI